MRLVFAIGILLTLICGAVGFRPKHTQAAHIAQAVPTICDNGLADSYPCSDIDLLTHMPLKTIGATAGIEGADIWGWTDARDGREYALMTLTNGTAFIDVTNPLTPIYLAHLPTATVVTLWRDVKVYNDHAYIVADKGEGHGVQIVDLRRLRDIVAPPVTLTMDGYYEGVTDSHNIVINEESGTGYAVGSDGGAINGCSGGLHIMDLSNPKMPTFAGCFSADGYTHDAQCVNYIGPDSDYVDAEICFASNEDTVTIVDVTDKANPSQIAREDYPTVKYTHQGWVTEDHQYWLVNDERDELLLGHNTRTYIWDVRDLDNPQLVGQYDGPSGSIDHNLYIHEGLVYEANYRAGLRILDGSQIPNGTLTEIAYFDIYPGSNAPSFNGAWSSYPYFESDTVLVSGIEQGMFALRPQLESTFRLAITPSRVTRCGDSSLDLSLMAEQVDGFAAPITISAESNPSAPSLVPTSTTQLPNTAQQLDIVSSGVQTGTYSISVTGTTVSQTHSTTLLVHQLAQPITVAPLNAASEVEFQPSFVWSGDAAIKYRLVVATDAAFSTIVLDTIVAGTKYQPTEKLASDTTYYWRVSAETGQCADVLSATATFSTRPNRNYLPMIRSGNSLTMQETK